ncbi:transcriptional repressor [Candidatus Epulonipiscium fishelsonii]|uniref:Transcriptional repressor n=1 Tax=Candidatus Epulonipiscium fishelsonii TaxID=77094 RepID=A0ACC8XF14_9FIRM|nr:transcriptional repressor [Epulopiscium sp. SCG-B11WGA-EpuloA1]ONI43111.1 transcriptional repressor [Epulopiscium sp. SCG-B05WGA-EpuloA1]
MLVTRELLKQKNLKATPQRLAIFQVLKNTTAHPSAETIYFSLNKTHPTMSFATVYKTLGALVNSNLVQQINVGENSFRYDANVLPHPHIICNNCNEVHDLYLDFVDEIFSKVQKETDFKLSHQKLYFYGTCTKCQSKELSN